MGLSHAAKLARKMERRAEKFGFLKTPLPCVDCGRANASLVGGDRVYAHRPDLYSKRFWLCECGAFVGCHPGTEYPLGSPANAATRKARNAAHAAFDPLWQRKIIRDGVPKNEARAKGYKWLGEQLGIEGEVHISQMDRETALRVADVCLNRKDPANERE